MSFEWKDLQKYYDENEKWVEQHEKFYIKQEVIRQAKMGNWRDLPGITDEKILGALRRDLMPSKQIEYHQRKYAFLTLYERYIGNTFVLGNPDRDLLLSWFPYVLKEDEEHPY